MPREERTPKEYNREETRIISEIMRVDEARKAKQKEFNSMIRASLREDKLSERQKIQITKRTILKQRFVHLYVSGCYTNREIARILCISPSTVTKLLRDEEIKEMIKAYQTDENETINAALKSLRLKAVETQSELLDSDNDMVRYNVAKDILDRTGHKAEEKKTVNINHTYEERLKEIVDNVQFQIQDVPYAIDGKDGVESQINIEGEDNGEN
jgi:DNA-binding MarR family transcriptional regulator